MKTTSELVRIAAAGGGLRLKASDKTTSELALIASAASNTQAIITITSANSRSTSELALIAAAGKGRVVFEFD